MLGAVLVDARAFDEIAVVVDVDDLYLPAHREIYSAMQALAKRRIPIDILSLEDECTARGVLGRFEGGATYLVKMAAGVPIIDNVGHYAQIVREKSMLRRLIATCNDVQARAYTEDATSAELVDQIGRESLSLTSRNVSRPISLTSLIPLAMARMEAREDKSTATRAGLLPTGFDGWDFMTAGGLAAENLVIVAARPSAGKTSLSRCVAINAAKSASNVLVFSLEESRLDMAEKWLVGEARVDNQAARRGTLSGREWQRLYSAVSALGETKLLIDDANGRDNNITRIYSKARAWRSALPADASGLVVVDYLQLAEADPGGDRGRRRENRATEVAEITRTLKAMAKELKLPVVAISQLNREVEKENRKPKLSDLRECVAVGQEMYDAATGMWRPIETAVGATAVGIDGRWRAAVGPVTAVWSTGRKPVLLLRTKTGREIRATGNHPVRRLDGWTTLSALSIGDRIASPRRLPEPLAPQNPYTRDELLLLGYLISDGSYLRHATVSYTKADPTTLADVERIARQRFGIEAKRDWRGGTTYDMDLTTEPRGPGCNPLINWLKAIGIHGQRGPNKRVPEGVFASSNDNIAAFLGALWAGDGSVVPRRGGGTVLKFTSTSRGLLHDVQRLLMRLGVVAVIGRPERNQKSTIDIATLSVGESDAIVAFAKAIEIPGVKGARLAKAASGATTSGRNARVDRLPLAITDEVRRRALSLGFSHTDLGYRCQGKEMCRADLAMIAKRLGATDLAALAESDVLWDEVVAVEPDGDAETIDMRAPIAANLVVSGVFVHNSGAIEQDADQVVLLHATEEMGGVVLGILAKNRGGPTGEFKLAFLKAFGIFETYVDEASASLGQERMPYSDR